MGPVASCPKAVCEFFEKIVWDLSFTVWISPTWHGRRKPVPHPLFRCYLFQMQLLRLWHSSGPENEIIKKLFKVSVQKINDAFFESSTTNRCSLFIKKSSNKFQRFLYTSLEICDATSSTWYGQTLKLQTPPKTLNRILQGINFSIKNSAEFSGFQPAFLSFPKSSHLPQKNLENDEGHLLATSLMLLPPTMVQRQPIMPHQSPWRVARPRWLTTWWAPQNGGKTPRKGHKTVGRCRFLPKLLRDDGFFLDTKKKVFCAFSSTRCLFPASCLCL